MSTVSKNIACGRTHQPLSSYSGRYTTIGSVVGAIVLVSQGVVQTFGAYASATLVEATKDGEGKAITEQALARSGV